MKSLFLVFAFVLTLQSSGAFAIDLFIENSQNKNENMVISCLDYGCPYVLVNQAKGILLIERRVLEEVSERTNLFDATTTVSTFIPQNFREGRYLRAIGNMMFLPISMVVDLGFIPGEALTSAVNVFDSRKVSRKDKKVVRKVLKSLRNDEGFLFLNSYNYGRLESYLATLSQN